MILTTIVPKIGDKSEYLGKPVCDLAKTQIGTITSIRELDDYTYELSLEVVGLYTKANKFDI